MINAKNTLQTAVIDWAEKLVYNFSCAHKIPLYMSGQICQWCWTVDWVVAADAHLILFDIISLEIQNTITQQGKHIVLIIFIIISEFVLTVYGIWRYIAISIILWAFPVCIYVCVYEI